MSTTATETAPIIPTGGQHAEPQTQPLPEPSRNRFVVVETYPFLGETRHFAFGPIEGDDEVQAFSKGRRSKREAGNPGTFQILRLIDPARAGEDIVDVLTGVRKPFGDISVPRDENGEPARANSHDLDAMFFDYLDGPDSKRLSFGEVIRRLIRHPYWSYFKTGGRAGFTGEIAELTAEVLDLKSTPLVCDHLDLLRSILAEIFGIRQPS